MAPPPPATGKDGAARVVAACSGPVGRMRPREVSGRALESRGVRRCDARGSAEEAQAPESGALGETERFVAPAVKGEEEGGRAVAVAGCLGRPPRLAEREQWQAG